ncbi:MAG: molybdate ABC transporter substrate-binding protein [Planctomycetota bacterium]
MTMLLTAGGCSLETEREPKGGEKLAARSIQVAAATDLQPWLGEALAKWGREQSPPVEIVASYDASGKIAAQVRAGAPIDLFLSADIEIVRRLATDGFVIPESVKPYARGRLALLVRKSLQVGDWKRLNQAEFRHLVIANTATAPYGKAAKQALEQAGLWAKLEARIVVADSVRQALQQVTSGNAEAGLVALGHAREAAANDTSLEVLEIPPADYPPIVQGLGLVSHADQSSESRVTTEQAMKYLTSPAAEANFEQHGLSKAGGL